MEKERNRGYCIYVYISRTFLQESYKNQTVREVSKRNKKVSLESRTVRAEGLREEKRGLKILANGRINACRIRPGPGDEAIRLCQLNCMKAQQD